MKNPYLKIIITAFLTLGLSVSLQSTIAAWQPPAATAPQGNPEGFLNTSNVDQDKIGGGLTADFFDGTTMIVGDRMAINNSLLGTSELYVKADSSGPPAAIYIHGDGTNPEIALGNGISNTHWAIYADKQGSDEFRIWRNEVNVFRLNINGNLEISGTFKGDGSDITNLDWNAISTNMPAGFSDGVDNGITTESDPTVLNSVKDGVSWSEIALIPAGFLDGIDNTGITTELDPQVGSLTNGRWCTSDGTHVNCTSNAPSTTLSCPCGTCWSTVTGTCPSDYDGSGIIQLCTPSGLVKTGHAVCTYNPNDDNTDLTPEDILFYKKIILENKTLIKEGKREKSLH